MNFAIIAAGEGSRLAAEGITVPKSMVLLDGTPLIGRLISMFEGHDASSVSVIVNEENLPTIEYLQNSRWNVPLNLVIKSTPGSMHSLYALKPFLQGADFCLTTVDTVFRKDEFTAYIRAFQHNNTMEGIMAVTDFVDDEKPLYVATNEKWDIINFCDSKEDLINFKNLSNPPMPLYVSGGMYCLRPKALEILETVMQQGIVRMRDFQRALIQYGMKLQAFPFSKIVDIDHVTDIEKAEELINAAQASQPTKSA